MLEHYGENPRAQSYIDVQARLILANWEPPNLLVEFSLGGYLQSIRVLPGPGHPATPGEVRRRAEANLNVNVSVGSRTKSTRQNRGKGREDGAERG